MMENDHVMGDGNQNPYVDLLRDHTDKVLFFGVFGLGTIFILVMKALDASQLFVTLLPCILIGAYAAIAWSTLKFRLREDRIAENCYYLGLLFTLVSLACALYAFTADSVATRTIITNFGVALSTTIVGLALRVLISQLREDPIEFEREARLELAEATAKLTGELHSSVEDLASFRRSMFQVLEEGMTEIAAKATRTLEDNSAKVAAASNAVIERIGSTLSTFSTLSSRLKDAIEVTALALEEMFNRIENIDASPEMISRKLDPLVAGFHSLLEQSAERGRTQAAEFSRITKAARASQEAVDRLELAHQAIEHSLRTGGENFAREMAAGANAAAQMKASLEALASAAQEEIAATRRTTEAVGQMLTRDLEGIQQLRQEAEIELEMARALVSRMHMSMISLADQITDRVSAQG
jgi:hypothetical protein